MNEPPTLDTFHHNYTTQWQTNGQTGSQGKVYPHVSSSQVSYTTKHTYQVVIPNNKEIVATLSTEIAQHPQGTNYKREPNGSPHNYGSKTCFETPDFDGQY